MDELAHLRNRWVHFKLRDVFVPPAQEVLEQLHAEDLLHGRVMGFTQRGAGQEIYVISEVQGLNTAVVVPLAQIVRVV